MKWSWPNLRLYPGICPEILMKTTKPLSQISRSPSRDLNLEPPDYEVGVLLSQPRLSVKCHIVHHKTHMNYPRR
jgi:hypothetical protein